MLHLHLLICLWICYLHNKSSLWVFAFTPCSEISSRLCRLRSNCDLISTISWLYNKYATSKVGGNNAAPCTILHPWRRRWRRRRELSTCLGSFSCGHWTPQKMCGLIRLHSNLDVVCYHLARTCLLPNLIMCMDIDHIEMPLVQGVSTFNLLILMGFSIITFLISVIIHDYWYYLMAFFK